MQLAYIFGVIGAMSLATFCTRAIPFFAAEKMKNNELIRHLGKYLPATIMFLLIVHCIKETPIQSIPYGIPEFTAITYISIIHAYKRNTLLSLVTGTLLYMTLLPNNFVINFFE
ncbi:MAG: branched-subunit amino acid transport protein AzlD [Chlamydiales bacterium]|jgi:branched-subunit amino acid transport protein AzlD